MNYRLFNTNSNSESSFSTNNTQALQRLMAENNHIKERIELQNIHPTQNKEHHQDNQEQTFFLQQSEMTYFALPNRKFDSSDYLE